MFFNIVVIKCDYGLDDMHFAFPDTMPPNRAVCIVDATIKRIKKEFPTDYDYEDLEHALEKHGITPASFHYANKEW